MLIADRRGRAVAPARMRRTVPPSSVLLVACLGVSLAFLDNTIVSIAFPSMLATFSAADLGDMSWVFNVYNIAIAALVVPAGRLADLLGRRRLFAWGVVVFTVASAVCALAPSVGVLIAGRALQGAGAAILLPASLALILQAFPVERRAWAIGVWTATGALAAGIGPSIGGGLVNLSDWRLVFLINLPLGVLAWRLAHTQLVESRAPGRRAVPDLPGAALLGLAIGALTLAIVQSDGWGWLDWRTAAVAAGALAAGSVFVRRCRVHAAPIIDLDLLRSRQFAVANVMTVVGSAGFFAVGLANILYLIEIWGYSPLTAGLAGTPAPFLAAVAAVTAGKLIGDRDPRPWIAAGALIWAAGPLILIERFSTESHYLTGYLPGAAVLAIGIGITFPLVSAVAVMGATGGRYAGATAMNTSIRQIGAALGVAILVTLVGEPSPAGVEDAFQRAWLFATVCFLLVAVAGFAMGRVQAAAEDVVTVPQAVLPAPVAAVPTMPERRPVVRAGAAPVPRSAPEFLAEVPLFAGLDGAARSDLAARAAEVTLPAGQWLFRQGDEADALYVVRSGRLEIVDETPGGEPRVLRELSRGSVLGELALIIDSPRTASARVRRDAHLLRVAREDFEAVVHGSPAASGVLLRTLGSWLTEGRADGDERRTPATIAIVALDERAEASAVDRALGEALAALDTVRVLTRADVRAEDPGPALSELLDRLEVDHAHVVLSAGRLEGDAWAQACVRQADRVILAIGDVPPALPALPHGCDALLLGSAPQPRLEPLLEELDPRALYRVREGAEFDGDVAVAARRLAGRSVGLVLSGGGARCFSQIGVVEELARAGVTIDRIGGTSMGAFIGALVAQGLDPAEIDARCYEEFVRRNPLGDYRFPRTSLIRGTRARAMLERNLPGRIEELPRSYFCVSVDLIAAETVQHKRGPLAESVGASMALPIFAPPVVAGARLLLDGALMDNLPTERMAADGEGPIIAVDATEPSVRALDPDVVPQVPTLLETVYKVMLLSESDSDRRRSFADVLIRPDYEGIGILEFHMLDRMREAGRRAAAEALSQAPASVFA